MDWGGECKSLQDNTNLFNQPASVPHTAGDSSALLEPVGNDASIVPKRSLNDVTAISLDVEQPLFCVDTLQLKLWIVEDPLLDTIQVPDFNPKTCPSHFEPPFIVSFGRMPGRTTVALPSEQLVPASG